MRGVVHGQDTMDYLEQEDDHWVKLVQEEYRRNANLPGEVSDEEPQQFGKDSFFGPPMMDQGSQRSRKGSVSERGSMKSGTSNNRSQISR